MLPDPVALALGQDKQNEDLGCTCATNTGPVLAQDHRPREWHNPPMI